MQEQNCPRCLPSFTLLQSYVGSPIAVLQEHGAVGGSVPVPPCLIAPPGWKQGELCAEQALPGVRGFLSRGLVWSFP